MATGITKNKWGDSTSIISSEEYSDETSYEICYRGKLSAADILSERTGSSYRHICGEGSSSLYYGENLSVLRHLLHSCKMLGRISLIYIDPPYGTNSIFKSRNQKDSYKDDLVGSHYLEFMRRRLILLRELLSDQGSIYVHLDNNMTSQVKIIMDEVFGAKNFRGMITRKKCSNKNSTKSTYGNISDYILFYSKTSDFIWHRATLEWTDEKIIKEYPCVDDTTGRRYKKVPVYAPGERNGLTGGEWRGMMPPKGKHWQYTPERLDELDAAGDIYWSATGNPRRKVYLEKDRGVPVQDIWMDVQDSMNQSTKTTGYPTEKSYDLLKRIIEASSNPGDMVLDCFMGSGTTLGAARELGRNWIGVDSSLNSLDCTLKRLLVGVDCVGNHKKVAEYSEQSLFDKGEKSRLNGVDDLSFKIYSDISYVEEVNSTLSSYVILDNVPSNDEYNPSLKLGLPHTSKTRVVNCE